MGRIGWHRLTGSRCLFFLWGCCNSFASSFQKPFRFRILPKIPFCLPWRCRDYELTMGILFIRVMLWSQSQGSSQIFFLWSSMQIRSATRWISFTSWGKITVRSSSSTNWITVDQTHSGIESRWWFIQQTQGRAGRNRVHRTDTCLFPRQSVVILARISNVKESSNSNWFATAHG